MTILSKIQYIFNKPEIANFPKFLAFAGLIYSAVLPLQAIALDEFVSQSEKPILLALADIRPIISSVTQQKIEPCPLMLTQNSTLISQNNPNIDWQNSCQNPDQKIVAVKKRVIVTAYSSTPDQTDNTPFITAMGTPVRKGVVACNFLKFGTKIRLPQIFGEQIFVVEDRMARWNSHKLDIWMPGKTEALRFGVKRLSLEILE